MVLHPRLLNGARTNYSNNSCPNRYNLDLELSNSMLSTTKEQPSSIRALQNNSILYSSSSLVLLVFKSTHRLLHHKPKEEAPMIIIPHHLLVRASWQWRDSIIIIIIIKLELPLVLLMHLPQASHSHSNSNSMVQVATSSRSMDTTELLPPIEATPTSNGNSTKENIDRTMAAVALGGTQITMMVGGMAIEGKGGIGCPLEVAPIIIIIIITIIITLAMVEEMEVVVGGMRDVVVEVTEVTSTTVTNLIAITTTGTVGVTTTERDTGDDLKTSPNMN